MYATQRTTFLNLWTVKFSTVSKRKVTTGCERWLHRTGVVFFFYMSRAVSFTQGRCSLAVVGQQYRLLFAAVSSIYLCEQMLSVYASLCFHRFNFNLPPLWFFVPSFIPVLGLGLANLSLSKECLEQRDKPSFMPLSIHPSISP
jgi:hypothetical protein